MMAQVVDINAAKPIKGEKYFVDTNVWYWTTYVSSKEMNVPNRPDEYQIRDYPSFIERALSDGAELCHCPFTFSELANIIENTELQIYRKKINNDFFEKKEFRRIKSAREDVLNEIGIAWDAINSISTCIHAEINKDFIKNSKDLMSRTVLDPYDAIYVQLMRKNRIDYIITDDRDFCSVDNQIIITANHRAKK